MRRKPDVRCTNCLMPYYGEYPQRFVDIHQSFRGKGQICDPEKRLADLTARRDDLDDEVGLLSSRLSRDD